MYSLIFSVMPSFDGIHFMQTSHPILFWTCVLDIKQLHLLYVKMGKAINEACKISDTDGERWLKENQEVTDKIVQHDAKIEGNPVKLN